MKTIEEDYVKYLCKYCINKKGQECFIRRKMDGTAFCENYEVDKEKIREKEIQ